jgi:rhomboid family GlyGly-CTERM serine protease
MIRAKSFPERLARHYWPTVFVLLCLLVLHYFHLLYDFSYLRGEVAGGQWWRVLSGQFVHNNTSHLFSNMVALLLCRILLSTVYTERNFVVSLLSCTLITGLAIHFLLPLYGYYLGISAALYGILIAGALGMLRGRPYWGAALLLLIVVKLARDYFVPDSVALVSQRIGVPVAVEGHFMGVFAGVLVGAGQFALSLIRPATLPPK